MSKRVEPDRYLQGYEDGYSAGLRDRQAEVDFLLQLINSKEDNRVEIQTERALRFMQSLSGGRIE